MSAEISFDSGLIQMILIIGIILLIGGYLYYENRKIKNQLLEFEYKLDKLSELFYSDNKNDSLNNIPYPSNPETIQSEVVGSEKIQSETINSEKIQSEVVHSETINQAENQNIEWLNIHNQMMNKNEKGNTNLENNDEKNISDIESSLIDLNKDEISKVEKSNDLDNENHDVSQSFIEENISIDDMLKDIIIDEDLSKETKDYSKMTVSQLKKILVEKNLPVSGNKTKLVQRILDNSE